MNRRVRFTVRLGRIGTPAEQYWLEHDAVASLDLLKAGLNEELQQAWDRYGVVAALQHRSVADTIRVLRDEVHAQVILIGIPLPNLNRQEPAVTFVAKTVWANIGALAVNGLVVADRQDRDAARSQAAVEGTKVSARPAAFFPAADLP